MSVTRRNSSIRKKVVDMYKQFVDEIDPKDVLDLLIQKRIIAIDRKEELMRGKTRSDQCRALLDHLFYCSHNEAFIVLREALREHYHWIVERIDTSEADDEAGMKFSTINIPNTIDRDRSNQRQRLQCDESKGIDSTDSRQTAPATNLEAANKRIMELEYEVIQYRKHNAELIKQLSFLQRSYDSALDSTLNQNKTIDKTKSPLENFNIYETVSEVSNARDKILDGEKKTDKTTDPRSGSPCLPSLPPRSSNALEFTTPENGAVVTNHPLLLTTIKGSEAVRGMAVMDNTLYVVRFGSMQMEIYDGKEKFKKGKKTISINPSPEEKVKTGNGKIIATKDNKKIHASSGLQDISCCHQNKRLYVSDWQRRCVHCVNPVKREIVRSWSVETGEPWGISVTSNGNVVVSCGNSGELCEYTSEGNLLRTVTLKMVEEGPWHGHMFGRDYCSWIFCHGERYGDGGYVSVSDMDGNYLDGYIEVPMHGPSHLALLPDYRVLVAESQKNRIVMLDPSLRGPVQEILNPDHGVMMPVRLHYSESLGQLFVGLQNGSILVYKINQLKTMVTAPSRSISRC